MLFDTHCHLDVEAFAPDREDIIARARVAGVTQFVNPAYDLESSQRATALAQTHADLYAAVGIHPNDIGALDDKQLSALQGLAQSPKVVAIGEIGLDYHWNTFPPARQKDAFKAQLRMAQALNLPVIIHCRDAYDDTLALLERHAPTRGVLLHSFAGSTEQAQEAQARGYILGIGGPLTYKNAHALRLIVSNTLPQHIVLETDAPYLSPQPHRGRRNEPAYLLLVAERLAALWGQRIEEVAAITTATARRFFRLT
jgi:TatD DNase family protein